ncbi:(R)-citramalate synthase CimA [Leptospira biflexa]|uniref:(R)-citramalate synthase CimA n=1 Tax=Leptospira biflexa TaxID=172 RepID=UPI00108363AF|nr:(R)-citramalate synthase CimA [Leptospira biflexa]TGM34087.1 2-isopropylmalate synthase [Leptospira biflexa]TGM40254.1 2-isopropylmalate synthase [Leptospira biflexa]
MTEPNSKIQILDVTLRDGEQTNGVSFSWQQKLNITKHLLKDLKTDRVEIASARVSPGEFEAVQKIIEWAKVEGLTDRIEILGFVDFDKTVEWMKGTGVKVLNLLTKGSLNHLTNQLRKTPEEHFNDIKQTVDVAVKAGITVNVYLEDWSNGYLHSRDYVIQYLKTVSEFPIKRFYLADTLGVMSPEEVKLSVSDLVSLFPDLWFEFHGHNDYDLAVANCLEAVKAGARGLHVAVNGLGERAGNSPLEAVVTSLHDKTKFRTSIVEKEITNASRLVEVFSGKRISDNRPIVGEDVFTQTAGVHADGDKKGNLYANPILPERFGRSRVYALGKLAGKASITENLKQLGMVLSPEIEKKVLERVIELGDQNKTVTKEDLPYIISDISGENLESSFRIEFCTVTSGIGVKPTADVKVKFQGKLLEAKGEGDGGYDAFMNALGKILETLKIQIPKLYDYEVRIPPGGNTNALVETVITWKKDGDIHPIRTIGIDSDQQVAAVKATERMLHIVLGNL